ncbi:PAS domain S-box-containing protein [Halospina denitrificans]|uniref:PAS domain S-box-containing protein n=1 Tax=Halospina denitrificans TaxID=332522 RepID=A0A4R7JR58_9GAMM|nr:PAS domain-containing protein [Halospina denitrificans]TDT40284.1 PAS domain S-box-containing protein [Halospina denitrificans]
MANSSIEPKHGDQLRMDAETRLRSGKAPPTNGWTLKPDTLALLYRLASNPDTASDGLKLLHELQTHQVELDLQQAQIDANERESTDLLTHYRVLFEAAPVGYLVVTLDGHICEANPAATQLLGVDAGTLEGSTLEGVLGARTESAVSGLMDTLTHGDKGAPYEVQSSDNGTASRSLVLNSSIAPDGNALLITLSEHA